jgi:glycosyltransferase involved in cell wall biosynthesis
MTAPVSVVVPTRDRPSSLRRCLAAIRTDAGAGSEAELIVADDGSADAAAVASVAEGHGASLVRLEGLGPAAARNRGAGLARGEVVLFTDDDCEPASGWTERLAAAALRDGVAAGRTVAPPGAGAAVLASQLVIDHLMLRGLDRGRVSFAPSCNLALTGEALARLPFDARFDLAAGEDREWSARAVRAGLAPAYEPEAVVVHRQAEGFGPFLARQVRYGRGAQQLRSRGVALAGAGSRAALIRRGFSSGSSVGALALVAQGATAAGAVAERLRST